MNQTCNSAEILFGMMVMSMVIFQLDEFFDLVVQKQDAHTVTCIRMHIDEIFESIVNDVDHCHEEEILNSLSKFVKFFLEYLRIQMANQNDIEQLRRELKFYLLAHIQHCEDNSWLEAAKSAVTIQPIRSSLFRWIRATGADNFGVQYASALIGCLLTSSYGDGLDFLPSAEMKYIVQDCSHRLAIIGRIYNDYGSLQRDRDEKNLNSTFFPEFEASRGKSDDELKRKLRRIADYERKCVELSLNELHQVATEQLGDMKGQRLFEIITYLRMSC